MDPALRSALARALGAEVATVRPVAGGDINQTFAVTLTDGRAIFVKANPTAPRAMFAAEARGLAWLAAAKALRVPRVLAVAREDDGGPVFLALELIAARPRARDFDERLGRGLAALHGSLAAGGADPGEAAAFGLDHDNFIGPLPQDNTPAERWPDFYRARRLEPLVRAAVDSGLLEAADRRAFDDLYRRLPALAGPPEPPARLHGDLWGGNLIVDEHGAPCLIDPAVYRGHREIDLAMMRLFGGFGPRVFSAYAEASPVAPGADERVPLYQLYPLLVHVNLFGGGYLGQVRAALRAFA